VSQRAGSEGLNRHNHRTRAEYFLYVVAGQTGQFPQSLGRTDQPTPEWGTQYQADAPRMLGFDICSNQNPMPKAALPLAGMRQGDKPLDHARPNGARPRLNADGVR